MAFTALTSGQTDADSPVDQTLMDLIRTNLDDLDAARVTNGDSHDHSAGDGNPIPQGGLKTTTGEVSTTSTSTITLTFVNGEYASYPWFKSSTGGTFNAQMAAGSLPAAGVWVSLISCSINSGTFYARQRYIQASPPYKIGATTWGHFLFLLRNTSTGDIRAAYRAEDPPWAYNGKVWLPKDHKDKIAAIPHPFVDYFGRDPATDGLEIVLVDLSGIDVTKWVDDNWKQGKIVLEDLGSVLTGMGTDKVWSDYTVPTIPNFTDKVKVITP